MENSSQHRDNLYVQIRECYGRSVYTYSTHHKKMNNLELKNKRIKLCQIFLSAISASGFLGAIITNERSFTVIGGIFSTLLLAVNLFFKDNNLVEEAKRHYSTAINLWLAREDYISLLTDFPILSSEKIVQIRDDLQARVFEIYKSSPTTDKRSYLEAQKALKKEEEQFFNPEEIDMMLPMHLRNKGKLSSEVN